MHWIKEKFDFKIIQELFLRTSENFSNWFARTITKQLNPSIVWRGYDSSLAVEPPYN